MNSELKEKLENLHQRLEELKGERKDLIQKFNNGETLSKEESKRNISLAKEIKSIENQILALNSICAYDIVKKDLNRFANDSSLTSEQKKALVVRLTIQLSEMNELLAADIKDELSIENISELQSKKQELEEELNDLQKEKNFAERRGNSTKNIDEDIKNIEENLEGIKSYEEKIFSENEIKADMKLMAASKTSKTKKQEIAEKYNSKIDAYVDSLIDKYLKQNKDDKLNKEPLNKKTKDKLNVMSAFLNRHKNKIAAIAGGVILIVSTIAFAKEVNKYIEANSKKNNDSTPSTSVEQNEGITKERIDSLVNKGYDEYSAMLMVENFSKDTIDSLLKVPYIEAITKYAFVKDFNLDYINDYENAFITYNIAPEKAVDYVNRSYEISKTNFYEDATINEIVEIVMALDEKELFTKNNANLAQSFNTSFNQNITEKYLFGELKETDINKMNALKYFAKEGSDMDDFLTNYSILVQEILNNPSKDEPKDKMYDFISIFAHTLNTFKNEVKLTDSETFNENAIVKDYYDWYMAYCSFIAPLYPTFNNPDVEVHGYIDENGVEVFESSDKRYMKYLELQKLMISGMQSPEIQTMCGQSRTLN